MKVVAADEALEDVLRISRESGYRGHNKHDALNSPFLNTFLGHTKWSRIVAIQAVMRSPVNIRSLVGVPTTRNPKGIGLWADAHLELAEWKARDEHLPEARQLLDWLLENPSQEPLPGLSWGYQYPWQDLGFLATAGFPNRVVTCWIAFAFTRAARLGLGERYLSAIPEIVRFLIESPNVIEDTPETKCLSYVPDPRVTWAVMDVPALVAAVLAEASEVCGVESWRSEARRLLNWVVDKQTDYGAWFYTHPAGDSLIRHDNYHTAIILDCFDRYRQATGDDRYLGVWQRGLAYYRDHLFESDGAPRWMNDRSFPRDIHGAASGILCFVRSARHEPEYWELAGRVLNWTLTNLRAPDGSFWYQRTRWYTKRFCLARWCNGWMSRALAAYCSEVHRRSEGAE